MKKLIGSLDCIHEKKTKVSEKLIFSILKNNLVLIIVKTEINIMDKLKNRSIVFSKCKSSLLYLINNENLIKNGVKCLKGMRLWHKPVFHLIIVKKGTERKIADLCHNKNKSIEEIEEILVNDIECIVEPLDDQLEFYGTEFIRKIMIENFPSFE